MVRQVVSSNAGRLSAGEPLTDGHSVKDPDARGAATPVNPNPDMISEVNPGVRVSFCRRAETGTSVGFVQLAANEEEEISLHGLHV